MFLSLSLFLLTVIFGGLTGGLVKLLDMQYPPIAIIASRFFIGVVIMSIFFLRKRFIQTAIKNRYLILCGLLFTANATLYTFGIPYTSLIMGQLLYVPTAIVVAVIGYIFLKEKLDRAQIIGLFMALLGMSILFWGSVQTSDILSFGTPLGNILIAIAMFSWAFYIVISRKLSHKYTAMQITLVNFLVASLFSLLAFIFMMAFGIGDTAWNPLNPQGILPLLGLGIIGLLFLVFFQQLIKKTSAFTSSLVTYANPVFAVFFGALFFKEHLTPTLIVGGLIIIAAVFYTTSYKYLKK